MKKNCCLCEHEEVDWMPFYIVDDKDYCGMCLRLALMCMEEHEKNRINTPCVECGSTSEEKPKLLRVFDKVYCEVCLELFIMHADITLSGKLPPKPITH